MQNRKIRSVKHKEKAADDSFDNYQPHRQQQGQLCYIVVL
jgi:hypothetical protein